MQKILIVITTRLPEATNGYVRRELNSALNKMSLYLINLILHIYHSELFYLMVRIAFKCFCSFVRFSDDYRSSSSSPPDASIPTYFFSSIALSLQYTYLLWCLNPISTAIKLKTFSFLLLFTHLFSLSLLLSIVFFVSHRMGWYSVVLFNTGISHS